MKIGDFIEQYNNATDKTKFVKKIIFRHYAPYSTKIAAAESVVQLSSYDENGNFRINSPLRYLLWIQAVLQIYTTLELGEKFADTYDALDQAGVVEEIINAVGRDAESLQTIIGMTLDDLMTNERELPSYIEHKLGALSQVLESLDMNELQSVE